MSTSYRTRQTLSGQHFCGDSHAEAAHGTRAGGTGGSTATAGAHEAGARRG